MRTLVTSATAMLCLLCASIAVAGERETFTSDVDTELKPWTRAELNNDPDTFHFALISDNAGGPREGILAEAIAKLNLLQPEFVVGTGDYIEGYEETREQIDKQRAHFVETVKSLEMPLFLVPGNHDVGRPVWTESWNAHYGKTRFHFVYKNVLFLCLNTNDGPEGNTGISAEQVEYAKKVLSENAGVRYTFVFQHKPLWNEDNAEWKQIAEALKGRPCTVFAGHTHNYLSQEKDGISYITQATTGGGSAVRGPVYGDYDGITWVTVSAQGPKIATLLLDGILDRDFRTPDIAKERMLFSMEGAIKVAPIVQDTSPFHQGASTVTITNPSEQPLRVKVLSEVQAGIRVEPSSISVVVPGKSEHKQDLVITADTPVPTPEMQPVILHWTAAYDHGDNTPSTEFAGEKSITVDAPYAIPVAAQAPAIDGKLDDWAGLPFAMQQPAQVWHNPPAWKGAQDGSFRFGVIRDDKFLYVAVKATDNEPCFDGWKYWEDFASVFVDARASDAEDPKEAVFSIIAGPQIDAKQAEDYAEGKAPLDAKSASLPTEDGFAAEFAIPLSYLDERQGGEWKQCRLNVAFGDYDRGEARDGVSLLYWRPEWNPRRGSAPTAVFTK